MRRPKRREIFQLLAASVIYHVNGVRELPDRSVHARAVPASKTVAWDADRYGGLFDPSDLSPFGPRARRRTIDYYGNMHLASASLRIPTVAYLLALEPGSPFASYLNNKKDDLDRTRKLRPQLKHFRRGCDPTPSPAVETPCAYYLAVVVAERDRMVHGAEGSASDWGREREDYFSLLNQCQLIEAQLSLLRLACDDLMRLRS